MRAALYLPYRSPADLESMRSYCLRREWEIVGLYDDLPALYADARLIDIALVAELERLIDRSPFDVFFAVSQLLRSHIAFASASPDEKGFCTLGGGAPHMLALSTWVWRRRYRFGYEKTRGGGGPAAARPRDGHSGRFQPRGAFGGECPGPQP